MEPGRIETHAGCPSPLDYLELFRYPNLATLGNYATAFSGSSTATDGNTDIRGRFLIEF